MGKRTEDSWFMGGVRRRNFRQDQTGAPEVPRHRKAGKKKKKYLRKGCPGNDGRSHVFVTWTELVEWKKPILRSSGSTYEVLGWERRRFHQTLTVCAGCDKVKSTHYDLNEYFNSRKVVLN